MSRPQFPYTTADISSLAKALRRELVECDSTPGHVELLNMLARAAGYRNFQHFRSDSEARERLEAAPVPAEPINHRRVEQVARCFDGAGVLTHWPAKLSHQELCLWYLWTRIPARVDMSEKEVNDALNAWHSFGDPAMLRRDLFAQKMLFRTLDCRLYRRIEHQPLAEALALIGHIGRRRSV